MQKGQHLQFCCHDCNQAVQFSVFNLEKTKKVTCPSCGLQYDFEDETLLRQLKLFEALCFQIHQSSEILSNTSIGISLGDREFKIPYKLLLTRLNSILDLVVGNRPLSIIFRIEPASELKVENYSKKI